MKKGFKIVDDGQKVLPGHRCHKCQIVVVEVYECQNRCGIPCNEHLPKNKKCEICEESFSLNQNLSELIQKRYKVSCINCLAEMMLENFDRHCKTECKLDCPQKCGLKLFDNQLEEHIEKECVNTIINCVICNEQNTRGLIRIHEESCSFAQKHFNLVNPLKEENEELKKDLKGLKENFDLIEQDNQTIKQRINTLEQDNQTINQKISSVEQENESLKQRILKIENEISLKKIEKEKRSNLKIEKYNSLASISNQNDKWIVQKSKNGGWDCNICTNPLDPNFKKVYVCKIVKILIFPF